MNYSTGSTKINSILLNYLFDVTPQELYVINSHVANLDSEEITRFCILYRNKRKDPTLILILALLGLFGVAGIHRFMIGSIGLGIVYLLTAGLCFIGTIVDAINYKSLALEYNSKMIAETLMLMQLGR